MTKNNNYKHWYIYIIECSDGTFYTGLTHDINKRVARHNRGNGAIYTRTRTPVKLIYAEQYSTHLEAARKEIEIKKYSHKKKEKLSEGFDLIKILI